MDRGRKICDVLKAVRKKIADMNGIAYEPRVCHFKGHCSGTCPACETERKYHYCPVKILDLEINRVDHHPLGR